MTTLVLIPGLISDGIVWQRLEKRAPLDFSTAYANLSEMTSITGAAEALLNEFDGSLVPVGHSMGGRIALEMARLAPGRVKGLVLANTGHAPRKEAEVPKRLAMIALGHTGMGALADEWLPPMMDPARVSDRALMADLKAMVLRSNPDMHERQIRALMDRPNATEYLGGIACPVLLITGRQDSWSPIAQHQEIADELGDAELVIIENAGHFAPVERPNEVTDAIVAWLERKIGARHD